MVYNLQPALPLHFKKKMTTVSIRISELISEPVGSASDTVPSTHEFVVCSKKCNIEIQTVILLWQY